MKSSVQSAVQEFKTTSLLIRILIIFQLFFIVTAGLYIARAYTPWSLDEGAHYDYIGEIAENGRIPVLKDPINREVIGIPTGEFYKGKLKDLGVAGTSYEAFQPPLYYALAAPFWHITSDTSQRYKILRAVGVIFLLLTIVMMTILSRLIVGKKWPYALAFCLPVMLAPGMLFRFVFIGNAALEPLVTIIFITFCVKSWQTKSYKWLILSGASLALCFLTRSNLVFLSPILIIISISIWWQRGKLRKELFFLISSWATFIILITPWLVLNQINYGTWTAQTQARNIQADWLNYRLVNLHFLDTISEIPQFFTNGFALPQETAGIFGLTNYPLVLFSLQVLQFLIAPVAVVLGITLYKRSRMRPELIICAAPFFLLIIGLCIAQTISDWPILLTRYAYGGIPTWAIAAYLVYRWAIPDDQAFSRFVAITSISTSVAVLVMTINFGDSRF